MNETKTASILQRLPVILAVTAASYGLTLTQRPPRLPQGAEATAMQPAVALGGQAHARR